MARQLPWRALGWAGLLGLAALAAVPFAAGRVSPAVLRVAGLPAVEYKPGSQLEAPALPAPFSAEGAQGGLEWRVEGEGIAPSASATGDPFDHDLRAPRLVVLDRGAPLVITARRGRLRLPPRDGPRVVRLDLEGGVRAEGGGVVAATERLSITVDRGASGRDAQPRPAEVRVEAREAVEVDVAAVTSPGAARGAWRLTATGLEGTASPLDLALRGPVELSGTAPAGSSSLAGRPATLRATRARLVGRGAPSTAAGSAALLRSPAPGALRLVLDEASAVVAGAGGDGADGRGRRATLDLARSPRTARAALGGAAGATPARELDAGGGWTLVGAELEGAVALGWREAGRDLAVEGERLRVAADGALRLEGGPARVADAAGWIAAPALFVARSGLETALVARGGARFGAAPITTAGPALEGAADSLSARLVQAEAAGVSSGARTLFALRALDARGAPVRLTTTDGADALEATRVTWRGEGPGGLGRLVLEGPVRARALEDAPGERPEAPPGAPVERPRDPGPWRFAADGVDATFELDRLAALQGARGASARPGVAELLGATTALRVERLDLERGGPLRRQVALAGDRLDWERLRGSATLHGDVRARIGDATLRAPQASFDPATREVTASGGVACASQLQAGALVAQAWRATARLATDPAAWSAASDARRSARRLGGRFVLPATLEGLTLEGDAAARVRLVGAKGLSAQADRATLEGDLVRLEARPGAPPVVVASADGRASARAIDARLSRVGPRTRAWVVATGDVETSGAVELRAAWAVAEVWEPLRPARPKDGVRRPPVEPGAAIGPFAAGGPAGVRLRVASGADAPVELVGGAVRGDGAARTLRVEPLADRPVAIARGTARFEADAAQVDPLPGEQARVALSPPWRAAFDLRSGPATARGSGPLTLDVDLAAARARARGGVLDEVRRLVHAFDASGGLEVEGPKLRATAATARLRGGEVLLTGEPVEVIRGTFRSRTREQVLLLDEE